MRRRDLVVGAGFQRRYRPFPIPTCPPLFNYRYWPFPIPTCPPPPPIPAMSDASPPRSPADPGTTQPAPAPSPCLLRSPPPPFPCRPRHAPPPPPPPPLPPRPPPILLRTRAVPAAPSLHAPPCRRPRPRCRFLQYLALTSRLFSPTDGRATP